MIHDDAQLNLAIDQMRRMYTSLRTLKIEVYKTNPSLYSIMAEGPLDAIRSLEQEIDAYTGRTIATEQQAEIWIRVVGSNISWPRTPSSILTSFLDSFRKGLGLVSEYQSNFANDVLGELRRACDLRVVAFLPGSVRMGVSLPDEPVETEAALTARQSLAEYINAASWAASDRTVGELELQIGDPDHRRATLNALKPLVPKMTGEIDTIEISGRAVPQKKITLTKHTHSRIDHAIQQSIHEHAAIFEGRLREIDLDKLSFTLRQSQGEQMLCEFPKRMIQQAKQYIDRDVRVIGVRTFKGGPKTQARLNVSSIEATDVDI